MEELVADLALKQFLAPPLPSPWAPSNPPTTMEGLLEGSVPSARSKPSKNSATAYDEKELSDRLPAIDYLMGRH